MTDDPIPGMTEWQYRRKYVRSKWLFGDIAKHKSDILDWTFAQYAVRPGEKVVDVGAGIGLHARWLSRMGYEVTAVEPNAKLTIGLPVEVRRVKAYGQQMPFEDDSFDVAYAVSVMHHVGTQSDRIALLLEMMRVAPLVVICEINRVWPLLVYLKLWRMGEPYRAHLTADELVSLGASACRVLAQKDVADWVPVLGFQSGTRWRGMFNWLVLKRYA